MKPTNGGNYGGRGKGGYNKSGYNRNRGRGGNGSGRSEQPSAPAREPRSDTAGTLYGKIEVNNKDNQ